MAVLATAVAGAVLYGPAPEAPRTCGPAWRCQGTDALGFDPLYCCLSMITGPVAMAAERSETLANSTGEIALGAGPAEIALAAAPSSRDVTLASRLSAVGSDRHLYLIVRGLRTNEQPEALYQIYLALPRAVAPTPDGLHYVGSFNFFNAESTNRDDQARPGASRSYSFDVTDLVKTLQARKALNEPLKVTVVPTGTPRATAKPLIGDIALVAQ